MAYSLSYTAVLTQTDRFGNSIGPSYAFSGSQFTGVASPQASDLQALATAMGSDVQTKMVGMFPIEFNDDGATPGTGGQG